MRKVIISLALLLSVGGLPGRGDLDYLLDRRILDQYDPRADHHSSADFHTRAKQHPGADDNHGSSEYIGSGAIGHAEGAGGSQLPGRYLHQLSWPRGLPAVCEQLIRRTSWGNGSVPQW